MKRRNAFFVDAEITGFLDALGMPQKNAAAMRSKKITDEAKRRVLRMTDEDDIILRNFR